MPEFDLEQISDYYGLSPIESYRPNLRGLTNATYELGQTHFFTIFESHDPEELDAMANIACSLAPEVPIARPIKGRNGYSISINDRPALLTPRLPGIHYVGIAQSDKKPIPDDLHTALADTFWAIQSGLSNTPPDLKARLLPSRFGINTPEVTELPEHIKQITEYAPDGYGDNAIPTYEAVVHEDMERQNILCTNNAVTGIVDLEALRIGDTFYEFSHFLFNIVFCDPNATIETPLKYIESMEKAGVIQAKHAPLLRDSIFKFAVNDMIEIQELTADILPNSKRYINPDVLSHQYGQALQMAKKFFTDYYSTA